MGKAPKIPTAEVLQNKGAPVSLLPDAEGNARPTLWVRFTANTLADLELRYDGLEGLEGALEARTFDTVRFVLALVHAEATGAAEPNPRAMGAMVNPAEVDSYASAIGAALALATGVDPTQARQLLVVGVKAAGELRAERDKAVAEMLAEVEDEGDGSPGASGGAPGSPEATTPTSSGD